MSTSTVTPFAHRGFELLLGAAPPPPRRSPDSWQKLIGEKPIGARLDVLPERQTNWRALATSTFAEVGVVVVLICLQIFLPQDLITKVEYDVMPLAGPMIEIPKSKPEPLRPKVQPQPIPAPQPRIAKLYAPAPLLVPKPKAVEIRPADVPKVEQAAMLPKLDVPDSEPVRPREVKTGVLGDSPAGGGFGDPHGLPGAADPSKRVNIAHVGAFDADSGPGLGSGSGNGTGVGGYGGKGNGVVSSGFGNGTDIASGKGEGGPRVVQTSGFQSSEVLAPVSAKAKPAANEPPPATAVAILSKPNPAYTDEARRLGVEGEVLLNVVFLASGQVKVDGVSKGLGHGLDEAAIRAAQQIRFKPAMQDGQPVDFPATVHIVFQLAF